MRLRCPGITSILGTNNPQRCRRYRGKPYHGISIPTVWFSGIYSFNERRIFKSLSACKSTLFRGVKSQKPNRRNKGIAKWSANIYRKSLAGAASRKVAHNMMNGIQKIAPEHRFFITAMKKQRTISHANDPIEYRCGNANTARFSVSVKANAS